MMSSPKKRRPPISRSLVKNSTAAMLAAVEMHNKPVIAYRYEVVVLLAINAWELLLKAYIYKHHQSVKLFRKDGTTKQFLECVGFVASILGKDFLSTSENLQRLYEYKNQVAHFHSTELDPILFLLMKRNVQKYAYYLLNWFSVDISAQSDLILLPIGFKRLISPISYISNTGHDALPHVKRFLNSLTNSSKTLADAGIDEPVFVDMRVNLINEKRTKNADLIAAIRSNADCEIPSFSVIDGKAGVRITNDPKAPAVRVVPGDQSDVPAFHDSLHDQIFDEINNVIEANSMLAPQGDKFVLGENVYYRIYAERNSVNYNIETFETMARTALFDINAPCLFWLAKLPAASVARLMYELHQDYRHQQLLYLVRLSILVGHQCFADLKSYFEHKYRGFTQKPEIFWSVDKYEKHRAQADPVLWSCRATRSKAIKLSFGATNSATITIGELIDAPDRAIAELERQCLSIFDATNVNRGNARLLDLISFGPSMTKCGPEIYEALKELKWTS